MTDPNLTQPETALSTLKMIGVPVTNLSREGVPDEYRLCSFGPENDDFEDLLFSTEEDATKTPEQFLDVPFPVKHWSAKPITLKSEDTGIDFRAVRLVLISPDSDTISFASIGALKSWDLVRTVRGDGPYDPPLRIAVSKVNLGGKKFTWRLRPAK